MANTDTAQSTKADAEHFLQLCRAFDTAMFTTHARKGALHARPMILAEVDDAGHAWLMTDVRAEKVEELNEDARVSLTMQSDNRFATLAGKAEVVRDQAHVQRLWNAAWQVWFPEGPTDENIVLLKVKAQQGEYWDNAGISGAKYLYRAAKAYVSGERPRMDRDIHARVALQ